MMTMMELSQLSQTHWATMPMIWPELRRTAAGRTRCARVALRTVRVFIDRPGPHPPWSEGEEPFLPRGLEHSQGGPSPRCDRRAQPAARPYETESPARDADPLARGVHRDLAMQIRSSRPKLVLFTLGMVLVAARPSGATTFTVHGYQLGERIALTDGTRVWTAQLDVTLEGVASTLDPSFGSAGIPHQASYPSRTSADAASAPGSSSPGAGASVPTPDRIRPAG